MPDAVVSTAPPALGSLCAALVAQLDRVQRTLARFDGALAPTAPNAYRAVCILRTLEAQAVELRRLADQLAELAADQAPREEAR